MLPGLLPLLKQAVTIAPYSSQDAYGQVTWGAGVAYDCMIVQTNKKIVSVTGEEVVSSTQIYLDGSVSISTRDKVTLPDASTPRILQVENFPALDGTSYVKVVYT